MKPQFREREKNTDWSREVIQRKTSQLQFPPYSPINYSGVTKQELSGSDCRLAKGEKEALVCAAPGRPWDPISICIAPAPPAQPAIPRPPGIDCLLSCLPSSHYFWLHLPTWTHLIFDNVPNPTAALSLDFRVQIQIQLLAVIF